MLGLAERDTLPGQKVFGGLALPSGRNGGVDLPVAEVDHHEYGLAFEGTLKCQDIIVGVRDKSAASQRRVVIVQRNQFFVNLGHVGVGIPVYFSVIEEIDPSGIACFLAAVQEDAAVNEGCGNKGGYGSFITEKFPDRGLLGMFVVVGCETQLDLA